MSTIVTRAGKGTALTWTEMDANFTNLNNDKYESGSNPTFGTVTATTYNQLPVFDGLVDGVVNAGSNSGTLFLRDDGTWAAPSAGAAGGSNTEVQYNSGGVLAGEAVFTYNAGTNTLTVPNLSMSGDAVITGFVSATNGLISDYLSLNQPGSAPVRGWYTPSTSEMRGNIATTNILNMRYDASYSFVVGVGVVPTAWSNTILPAYAVEIGDRASVSQFSGGLDLGWNTKVDSAYAYVARTASGTPALLQATAGTIALKAAASNPGAGSAITFTTLMTARGNSDMDVSLDCGRLKFPATQNPSSNANTLDDYKEGTYTPTITAGSGTFTTVSAVGKYTKIGNQVSVQVRVTITTAGTAANSIIVTLPFNTASDNYSCGTAYESSATAFGGSCYAGPSTGSMDVYKYDGTTLIASGRIVNVSMTYFV